MPCIYSELSSMPNVNNSKYMILMEKIMILSYIVTDVPVVQVTIEFVDQ